MSSLVQSIVSALQGKVSGSVIVFFVSMIPILELRGSILAVGIMKDIMKMDFLPTFIAAVLGNMLPIPFILLFIKKIFAWMKTTKHLHKLPDVIEKKALSKSAQIEKYGYFGLFLFVAIPLPGTGAWTGSLLAVLFGLKPKKSLFFIFLGVLTAGLIMSLLSFGIIQNIIYHG